jgi:F-type H+-transporting ATPase subunit b
LTRTLRQAAFLGLLGLCSAGFTSPRVVWSWEASPAAEEKNAEPAHELLYKVINFAILVGGLAFLLRKPLAEFFSSRAASIRKGLEDGRKALEASQAQLQKVEEKLRHLEEEIAALKASAAREMETERQRWRQLAAEEAARIVEAARTQMGTAVRGAKQELKNYVTQRAVTLAEALIHARLDEAGHKRLVSQFVATLGKGAY